MIKTESLLKELFENPKNIVLVTDEQFIIRYASDTIESVFGVSPYSLLGKNAFDFVSEDKREAWRNCLIQKNGNVSDEISLKALHGRKVYFDVTVTNHVDHEAIHGIVIFLHDVTERKEAHQDLEDANNHLDHFIFKTTHDLRAPLHSALGLVKLAESADENDRDHYIGLIKKSLFKLDALIEEVNSFYKNDKLAVVQEQVDLEKIFKTELDYLKNLPGAEQIRFNFIYKGSSDLFSDSIRLKTIITNILSNSIKYMDPRKLEKSITLEAEVNETECTITITDNGLGIESQHLGKIFDMFYRATSQNNGTGLGLYIVKDTVDRLKGAIEVQSQAGKGTTFVIKLPNFITVPSVLN
jgi:PAS domain S-box-containing protein